MRYDLLATLIPTGDEFLMMTIQVMGIHGLPILHAGDDLAALICERTVFEDGDILCIASPVSAKANGQTRNLAEIEPTERATMIAAVAGGEVLEVRGRRSGVVQVSECRIFALPEEPFSPGRAVRLSNRSKDRHGVSGLDERRAWAAKPAVRVVVCGQVTKHDIPELLVRMDSEGPVEAEVTRRYRLLCEPAAWCGRKKTTTSTLKCHQE